jgi:hypothetical protein
MNLLETSTTVANSTLMFVDWSAFLEQGTAIAIGIFAMLVLWRVIHLQIGVESEALFQLRASRRIRRSAAQIADRWLEIPIENSGSSTEINLHGGA